jgi:predicted GH43/DUF377 family glycosyl hydrolase
LLATYKVLSHTLVVLLASALTSQSTTHHPPEQAVAYEDGRPSAQLRYDATDAGIVLPFGTCPSGCDVMGARDVWVYEYHGRYIMHYDAAGPTGWLATRAESSDLYHWKVTGPVLELGSPGSKDSASASYGTTYFDGKVWHMFYLGTPHTSPAPDRIPAFPYLTLKAESKSATGPWLKESAVVPFEPQAGTYYSATASPGQILRADNEYLQFFSASVDHPIRRTIGIARTKDLNGLWSVDKNPILPLDEQVENSSLYFEPSNKTWFLFTNHVGIAHGVEYTDAIWVYWSKDLNHWNPKQKAVVLDGQNCKWSQAAIGLPSVIRYGNRLAILYDAPGGKSISHMRRSIGLAWLSLPLHPPAMD